VDEKIKGVDMIKGFLIGLTASLLMIFVVIPSMFMTDTASEPLTLARVQNFYFGD
jgi:hypothetical protein